MFLLFTPPRLRRFPSSAIAALPDGLRIYHPEEKRSDDTSQIGWTLRAAKQGIDAALNPPASAKSAEAAALNLAPCVLQSPNCTSLFNLLSIRGGCLEFQRRTSSVGSDGLV